MRRLITILVLCIALLQIVSATTVSLSTIETNTVRAYILDAENIYAYEIALNYSGSYYSIVHHNFLVQNGTSEKDCSNETNETECNNGDSIYGESLKNNTLYVYASRLDNTQTGLNGTGPLFDIISDVQPTLEAVLLIDNKGNETYISFDGNTPTTQIWAYHSTPDVQTNVSNNNTNDNSTQNTTSITNKEDEDEGLSEREIWMILIGSFIILFVILVVTAYIITNSGKKKKVQQNTQYTGYSQQSEIYYRR